MKKPRRQKPRIAWRDYPWVVQTLTVIGVLAVVGVLVALFVAIGQGPHEIVTTSTPPADSRDFLLGISGLAGVPLREGGTARLLNNGDGFFPELLRVIRGARKSVTFSCYIWEKGKANDDIVAALVERARKGVEVRVLLDGFGGAHAPKKDMDAIRAAGGKVEAFRTARLGALTRLHKRNHRRAIVIDGTVGFTGGIAVADKWLGDAQDPDHWRDTMVEVTGPIAATLQSAFADLWAGTTGELLLGPAFFPPPEAAPSKGERITYHVGIASSPY